MVSLLNKEHFFSSALRLHIKCRGITAHESRTTTLSNEAPFFWVSQREKSFLTTMEWFNSAGISSRIKRPIYTQQFTEYEFLTCMEEPAAAAAAARKHGQTEKEKMSQFIFQQMQKLIMSGCFHRWTDVMRRTVKEILNHDHHEASQMFFF